jgi:microcystin degradation protein MlrC
MRIAVAGFQHETNTFAPEQADFAAFSLGGGFPGLCRGEKMFAALGETVNLPAAGFIAAARRAGHELLPVLWAAAGPSAHVTQDAYERIAGEIVERIRALPSLDAVYLDLHGAMVAQHCDDGEGELLARVRAAIGAEIPLVASLDLHANVTRRMLENADALMAFRRYPHVDMALTGARALALIEKRNKGRLAVAWRRIPFLIPICWQSTDDQPAARLYRRLGEIETEAGLASLSFTMGFPAADFSECGPVVWACGEDAAATEKAVEAMAGLVLESEPLFAGPLYSADEAVRRAMTLAATGHRPVVIADTQDNPGAGGLGDTTGVLRALLVNAAPRAALGALWDPAAAEAAHRAGEGARLHLSLGGTGDVAGDAPLVVDCLVEHLSDGTLTTAGPYYGVCEMNLGPSACLRIGEVRVVVASRRVQMADREMFRFIGIDPEAQDILVVKSSIHFRADFAPLAAEILTAIAPGPMVMRTTDWPWRRLAAGTRLMPCGPAFGKEGEDNHV